MVVGSPFADVDSAREAIDAYKSLLSAVHRHAWELAGGRTRIAGIGASGDAKQQDIGTVRFIDALGPATRARPVVEEPPAAGAGRLWWRACRSVGIATDLLATHRDPEGSWRTPDSWVLDDQDARAAGLAELADLAATALAAEPHLGLRAGQAGVRWSEVTQLLPDLSRARAAAADLLDCTRSDGPTETTLARLEVARPQPRLDDPLTELGERILRLRHHAWELTKQPLVGVGTLSDLAAAGVIVHAYASAYLTATEPGRIENPPARYMLRRAQAGQTTWSLIHLQTRQLRTATPGLGIVRNDVLAMRDLWEQLLPGHGSATADVEGAKARDINALVNGSVRAFSDIAYMNRRVFQSLIRSERIFVPSGTLTGDEVTDDIRLVAAKLQRRLVPAPAALTQALEASYTSGAHSPDYPSRALRQGRVRVHAPAPSRAD